MSLKTTITYHLFSRLRQIFTTISAFQYFFMSQWGFSIAGAGYTYYPVREGYFVSQIIDISNGSVFLVCYNG